MLLVALCFVALLAGFIDAVAGGGGLLTVPALMIATPDVRVALGTNKGQSVFGAFTALFSFARSGHVDRTRAVPAFISAVVGALAGVRLVLIIDPEKLRPIVLVLLVAVALFFVVRGRGGSSRAGGITLAKSHPVAVAVGIGFLLGLYDGFFGPGTGTFLIAAYVTLFGDDLTSATANAKVSNFGSNLASVASFAIAGKIDLRLALPMAGAQAIGGYLGAHAAIRGGERFVRAGVLLVTLALCARLAWQLFEGG